MIGESPAADIDPRRARQSYPFVFVVIGPERPVASTDRAIAGGRRLGRFFATPADCAAMTRAFNHPIRTSETGRGHSIFSTLPGHWSSVLNLRPFAQPGRHRCLL